METLSVPVHVVKPEIHLSAVSLTERSVLATYADLTQAAECWEIGLFATVSPGLEK